MRLSEPEIEMIDRAAELSGVTRAEFARNAAKEKAEDIILRYSEAA